MDASPHTAAGPLAGFLFQLERALWHLAKSPSGARVGVETFDDVALELATGQQTREQDAHSIVDSNPLTDRGKKLWKTLDIWLSAIDNEELDLSLTEFHLVTNVVLESGLAAALVGFDRDPDSVPAIVLKLREAGQNPSETIREYATRVLSHSDNEIKALVARLRVLDATCSVHGAGLRQALKDILHLPVASADEIIQSLVGWINDLVLKLLRDGKPAWISRDAFSEHYRRLLIRFSDKIFIHETAEALIPVSEKERAAQKHCLFVKQMQWVGLSEADEDNRILDGIDAFIRCASEAARLSQQGVVTVADFRAFDDRLVRRWQSMRRMFIPTTIPTDEREQERMGCNLLDHTLTHREPLANQPTNEYYLTVGAYHRLADEAPRVGWHPNFVAKVNALLEEKK